MLFSKILHINEEVVGKEMSHTLTHRGPRAAVFSPGVKIPPRRVLHPSARDVVPCAGPVVTHELRH